MGSAVARGLSLALALTQPLVAQGDAETLLRTGRYEAALAAFDAQLEDQPDSESASLGRARVLRITGRYDDAIEVLRATTEDGGRAGARLLLGEILLESGRVDEARVQLEAAAQIGSAVLLGAMSQLGELALQTGARAEAEIHFDGLIDAYNRGQARSPEDLIAVGNACRRMGAEDPQLFKDALRAYDEAVAADRGAVTSRVALAELFLDKYNGTEARGEVEAALALNDSDPEALLALARVENFEGRPTSMERARKALEINPSFVAARVFVAQLLLELEDFQGAAAEVETALATNPRSLEALTVLAGTRYLQGDANAFAELETRILGLNPEFAEFYNVLADVGVRNRLYREAVDFAARAVEIDPKSWRAWGLRGLNELRIGEIEAGRTHLELAFAGDPYNVWIKNTLDLVDTYVDYTPHSSQRFEVVAHSDEADLISPYALELLDEAYDELAARYKVQPEVPIRIEFYPSSADFSVRTIGLAGMGALGVCFGNVIAQDSPRARPRGTFNWASTLWHELTHTFTLAASEHRVPRWLTEGLSVLEERRARPGWGDDLNLSFLTAWRDGELLPAGDLNNGFVRPTSPQQVGLSYYQASLVAELIERDWGFDAVLALLHGYRDHMSTREIFRQHLDIEPEDFDVRFEVFLQEHFGKQLAAISDLPTDEEATGEPHLTALPQEEALEKRAAEEPGSFSAQLGWGHYLAAEGREDEAVAFLERARDLFPEYTSADSAYFVLARIYKDRDELEKAAAQLRAVIAVNETDYDVRWELAKIERELGNDAAALRTLEELPLIDPYDPSLHEEMAELYAADGDLDGVVRARDALVALRPTDMARAHYDLAEALEAAGRDTDAKRAVLRALEVAPAFESAQRLLLRLHGGQS